MSTDEPPAAGQPAEHDPTGLDVAHAVARSLRSAALRSRRGAGRPAPERRPDAPELSGSHPDGRDPVPVGRALEKLVETSGWEADLTVRSVFARWAELVGPEIADHCQPLGFDASVLRVRADSTAWATQLRLLAPAVVRRLNEELGHGSVAVLDVAGPDAPSWSRGRRAVQGGRGPRDTYG